MHGTARALFDPGTLGQSRRIDNGASVSKDCRDWAKHIYAGLNIMARCHQDRQDRDA
jgi:hypothetical protein